MGGGQKNGYLPVQITPGWYTLSVKLLVPAASSILSFTVDITNSSFAGTGGA